MTQADVSLGEKGQPEKAVSGKLPWHAPMVSIEMAGGAASKNSNTLYEPSNGNPAYTS